MRLHHCRHACTLRETLEKHCQLYNAMKLAIYFHSFSSRSCAIVWWIINCACWHLTVSVAAMPLSHLICNNAITVYINRNCRTIRKRNTNLTLSTPYFGCHFSIVYCALHMNCVGVTTHYPYPNNLTKGNIYNQFRMVNIVSTSSISLHFPVSPHPISVSLSRLLTMYLEDFN